MYDKAAHIEFEGLPIQEVTRRYLDYNAERDRPVSPNMWCKELRIWSPRTTAAMWEHLQKMVTAQQVKQVPSPTGTWAFVRK